MRDKMPDAVTGWEFERRTHFDEIVMVYDRARAEYPSELFEDIFSYSGPGKGRKALEIGAGTGKATTPILDAGYDVTAVELGANMADFLKEKFKGNRNFNVIVSAFEDVSLQEDSYDLIYAASSIHWVDAEIGCPKAFRLLKKGGVFALLRFDVVPAYGEELYDEIQAVYEKYYCSYYTSSKRPVLKTHEDFMKPSEIFHSYGFDDLRKYGFGDVLMKFYDVTRTFGADEYIDFLGTLADHRGLPDSERAALYNGIKEAILRHGGQYNVDHVFRLYIGRK